MKKSAESVGSLDPRRVVESHPRDIGDGHLEIDPTMRSRCVVVLDELFEDALEMTLASDEQPVEVKKSVATMPLAWARRNSAQIGPARLAGRRSLERRMFATLPFDTVTPSFFSSPTIRG